MERTGIARLIKTRLEQIGITKLKEDYLCSGPINHVIVDNLLPSELAHQLCERFPPESQLTQLDARQEKKYVGVEFQENQKLIEECIYAFQDQQILNAFTNICAIDDLVGDPELYAGGISSMSRKCFLNPHIDNSHDRHRKNYRRLNLLYYVSNNFSPRDGGQLLLYPHGMKSEPIEINSHFNRLVIMRTDNKSLHAVKEITSSTNRRMCISNYYFSSSSPSGKKYYHSTSFRGFPGELKKDIALRLSAIARTSIKALTGKKFGKYINTGRHKGGKNSRIN